MEKVAETKILHQSAVDYIIKLSNIVLAVKTSKKANYYLNLLLNELKSLKVWIEDLKKDNSSVKIARLIKVYSATQFDTYQKEVEGDTPVNDDYIKKVSPIKNDLDTLFEYLGQNNLAGAEQILNDAIQVLTEIIDTVSQIASEYPQKETSTENIDASSVLQKGDTIKVGDENWDITSVEGNRITLLNPKGEKVYKEITNQEDLDKLVKFKTTSDSYEKQNIKISELSAGDVMEIGGEFFAVIQKMPSSLKYRTQNLYSSKNMIFDPRGLKDVDILTDDAVERLINEFIKDKSDDRLPPVLLEEYDYLFK